MRDAAVKASVKFCESVSKHAVAPIVPTLPDICATTTKWQVKKRAPVPGSSSTSPPSSSRLLPAVVPLISSPRGRPRSRPKRLRKKPWKPLARPSPTRTSSRSSPRSSSPSPSPRRSRARPPPRRNHVCADRRRGHPLPHTASRARTQGQKDGFEEKVRCYLRKYGKARRRGIRRGALFASLCRLSRGP